jgi:hypothetical protein
MLYTVHCGRSGFEASHHFDQLDDAARFYNSEVENIGACCRLRSATI